MTSTAGVEPGSSRETILRTAAACFAKEGYAHARMVSIAEQAGISRAGLYKQFPSKGALLTALHAYMIDDWRAWLEDSVASCETACGAIERWLREGLADSWRVTAAQVVISEAAQSDLATDAGATQAALETTRRTLARILRQGIARGELRADLDVTATAHSLQAILLGLLRSQLADRPIVTIERKPQLDALVGVVLGGVAR
ncbi:MAG: TetR/AcrR family transcriptional regulator [Myxococcota bacterium]